MSYKFICPGLGFVSISTGQLYILIGTFTARKQVMELIADPKDQCVALIAEDDEKVGRMLGDTLGFVGFIPHLAFDGVQAMKDILAIKPAVIVLDLILPRMHAQEICSVVRSDPSVQNIPIVVISGWARQEEKEAVFRIGADDFLVKPFHPDELIASVRTVFERVRAGGQRPTHA